MEVLIFWVAITVITCVLASSKNRSVIGWGALSLVIGFIAPLILVLLRGR